MITVPYPGGKARLAKTIVSLLPKYGQRYIEPFAGRGNVFWRVAQECNYQSYQLNDTRTAPFFDAIKTVGGTISIPERTREEYYRQWERFKLHDPEAIILEPYLTFGGGGYGRGGFGNKKGATASGYQRMMRSSADILNRLDVKITALDWEALTFECTDVVYFDPPYKAADVRAYNAIGINYEKLARQLADAKFKWVLSEYPDPLYLNILGTPRYTRDVQLVVTNFAHWEQERRFECLWSNI